MSVLRYTVTMPRSTHLSPAARLELLLPWINHEGELRGKKLQSHLVGFLQGFRGSGLRAQRDAGLWEAFRDDPVREIHEARKKILRLLVYGRPASTPPVDYRYPDPPGDPPPDGWRTGMFAADDFVRDLDQADPVLPLNGRSLQFGICPRTGREPAEMVVDAVRLRDLLSFLVLHAVTAGGAVIARCEAPAPEDWATRCGRYFVQRGRGRPRSFCSRECKQRQFDQQRAEADRQARRKRKARKDARKTR